MAGAGVGVGGAGMLRARRRDCSVKPNRQLDRKSSRGMIYENEELRLRTIHINAEVEQGQNDIKKLRRENEQLRREIWSLRDEYEKLEEILKRQKSRAESEEYEDRSDEDDDLQSDYSFEEDEEDTGDSPKESTKSEQLENAENQKISSEKMTSNSLHRLHVDFDDLSVVDEEEEPKRDKEKKESAAEDAQTLPKSDNDPHSILKPRQLHENIAFYPATYQPPACLSSPTYYTECPFKFPSTLNMMLPSDASILASPIPRINADPLVTITNLGSVNGANVEQINSLQSLGSLSASSMDQMSSMQSLVGLSGHGVEQINSLASLGALAGPSMEQMNAQMLHAPPAGWQNSVVMPQKQITAFGVPRVPVGPEVNGSPSIQGGITYGGMHQDQLTSQSLGHNSTVRGFPTFPNFLQRKNKAGLKLNNAASAMANTYPRSDKSAMQNGFNLHSSQDRQGASDIRKPTESDESPLLSSEKPKHFFAPLPSRLKKHSEEPSPTVSQFGTGNSSSSGRTGSTIVTKNQYTDQKGSADVYVNGAIASEDNLYKNKAEQRTFLSTDNLLTNEAKPSSMINQLMKSLSCQDLPSKSQACIGYSEARQAMTQSDNTLDNISDSKPYKSHLNITLKTPPRVGSAKQAVSPDTPEIPNLPTIDYRLFKNPFLRNFDAGYMDQNNVTRPLSVQVNDDSLCYYSPQPEVSQSAFNRGLGFGGQSLDRYTVQAEQNRLLIPSNQLINAKSSAGKHQIQVTSFERPSPHTLIGPASSYELRSTLRRVNDSTPYMQSQNLYQNLPFLPRGGLYSRNGMMYYDNAALKVPAQTQTSLDGDSHHEDEPTLSHEESAPSTPSGQRRKKTARKEKSAIVAKDQKTLSPSAQRRLKKQASVLSASEMPESPGKVPRKRPRRLSITTTTTSEGQEDKNDSRSSSSGQDSPKKDQMRRVSLYFNTKKRPSLTSVRTARSGSLDITEKSEKDPMVMNSERERTNSDSSRETGSAKARKASTSSGNVPWCACWGNGCI